MEIKKTVLCFLLCLHFSSCGIIQITRKDNFSNCEWFNSNHRVEYDKNNGRYVITLFELGELGYFVRFTNCKLKKNNTIQLSGVVHSESLNDNLETLVFLCRKVGKHELEIKDTLTITDKNGNFTINVKKDKDSYIVIKEREENGIGVALKEINCCR